MPLTNVSPFSFVREQFLFDGFSPPQLFGFSGTGYALAYIVAVAPGERIDEVGFWSDGASGSFDATIAVESMSSSVQGNPSGTILTGINSQDAKSAVLHAADFASGMKWISINPYRNDSAETEIVAITFRKTSGAGLLTIRSHIDSTMGTARFPYVVTRASSSGDFSGILGSFPFITVRDDRQRSLACAANLFEYNEAATSSASTTDRLVGNKWNVDYACRFSQICFRHFRVAETSFDLLVYVNDQIRASQTIDTKELDAFGGLFLSTSSIATVSVEPIELDAGDVVRIVLKGNVSDEIWLQTFEFDSSQDRLAFTGGASIHRCYGSTTPVWVDTPTSSLAAIFPIIDQVNFAAGLGGSPGGGIQRSVLYRNVADQWVFFRLVDRAGVPINEASGASFAITLSSADTGGEPEAAGEPTNEPVFFADGVYGLKLTQLESGFDVIVLSAQHPDGSVAPVIIETSPQVPEVTIQPASLTLQN